MKSRNISATMWLTKALGVLRLMLFQWQTPKNDLITVGCKHLLAAKSKALEEEEEALSLQSHRR